MINRYNTRFSFYVLLLFCLSGCVFQSRADKQSIHVIHNPDDLSKEYSEDFFFLNKNINSEGVIVIYKLDSDSLFTYTDSSYIPEIDVSPDGRKVTFVQLKESDGIKSSYLFLVNLENNIKKEIVSFHKDYGSVILLEPSFASGGNRIFFSITNFEENRHQVGSVNIDGNELEIIIPDISMADAPVLSPKGHQILVTCIGIDPRTQKPCFQLCLIDQNGKFLRKISNHGDMLGRYLFTSDNSKIVFSEVDFGVLRSTRYRLCVVDASDFEIRVILQWEAYVNRISNNGSTIIFIGRPHKRSNLGVYMIDLDGSNLRHLAYLDEFMEEWYEDADMY